MKPTEHPIAKLFSEKLDLDLLADELRKGKQVECPVTHDFSPGVYIRTMSIPAGTMLIGKAHRHETANILLKGEISLYLGEGREVLKLKAPCIFNSKPGTRKLGYAHTDVLFSNVHGTDERDLEKIEQMFIVPDEELEGEERQCLGET